MISDTVLFGARPLTNQKRATWARRTRFLSCFHTVVVEVVGVAAIPSALLSMSSLFSSICLCHQNGLVDSDDNNDERVVSVVLSLFLCKLFLWPTLMLSFC